MTPHMKLQQVHSNSIPIFPPRIMNILAHAQHLNASNFFSTVAPPSGLKLGTHNQIRILNVYRDVMTSRGLPL